MSKENKNKVNEPYTGYNQPVTFEQVWKLFQETDKKFKETDKILTEKFQETDKKIDKLAKLYGGVSENSRDVAEEFFYRGLQSRNSIFGIEYDQVGRLEKKTKKLQGEYDIVLYDGNIIIVFEVKYKLHPNDIEDFIKRKLPNFRILFPEYNDKKVIGGVAGLSVPNKSYELAQSFGLLVLTQAGENISVLNPESFKLKIF